MEQITDSKDVLRVKIARTRALAESLGGDSELEQAAAYWEAPLMASEATAEADTPA